jgi:hypothetical protein
VFAERRAGRWRFIHFQPCIEDDVGNGNPERGHETSNDLAGKQPPIQIKY